MHQHASHSPKLPVAACTHQLHGHSFRRPTRHPQQTCRSRRSCSYVHAASVAEAPQQQQQQQQQSFAMVRSEQQFFGLLEKGVQAGKLPGKLLPLFRDFYANYKSAVLSSGRPEADEQLVATIMGSIADRSIHQFIEPFSFEPFHTRILEPYDYYAFGQNYVRTLINFNTSVVGHLQRFDALQQQLDAGENVVLLANHQTEADPGVWALLLERTHPRLATEIIYVAGDRVVTDPLCKPFSMGRNLFCVHSRKHMDDIPELKAAKQATNRRTVMAMARELNKGGKLLWIAPSGGRDRPDPTTGSWLPHRYGAEAVELMRQLLGKCKRPGHLYPLAMCSWEIMPPPDRMEKEVGERRLTKHAGTGIDLCEELDVEGLLSAIPEGNKPARQRALADAAWQAAEAAYRGLEEAIHSAEKRDTARYSQPWAA